MYLLKTISAYEQVVQRYHVMLEIEEAVTVLWNRVDQTEEERWQLGRRAEITPKDNHIIRNRSPSILRVNTQLHHGKSHHVQLR